MLPPDHGCPIESGRNNTSNPNSKHDPLDQLALALTCRPLLRAAALLLVPIRTPSLRHHAHLEPPCPATVRLQHIIDGFSSPSPGGGQQATARSWRTITTPAPANKVRYCPACCHHRPQSQDYWYRRVERCVERVPERAFPAGEPNHVFCEVVYDWDVGSHLECPECWLKAVVGPGRPRPKPIRAVARPNWRNDNLRVGVNEFIYALYGTTLPSEY
ncbi:hypothetical protein PG997_005384 [Apiospora hydei]|uniref:Uncharacterized protein n=1 Tax=Apiospora hydei TaxID=1337664 RepID=A0ABR1X4U0_9PEZI